MHFLEFLKPRKFHDLFPAKFYFCIFRRIEERLHDCQPRHQCNFILYDHSLSRTVFSIK